MKILYGLIKNTFLMSELHVHSYNDFHNKNQNEQNLVFCFIFRIKVFILRMKECSLCMYHVYDW